MRSGCADTTPTCKRTDAHFSRAHIAVHNAHIDPHFSNVGTPHWLKVRGICVAHFLCAHFHLFVMSLLRGPLVRFPLVASSLTYCLSRPSVSSTSLERSRINPCASAHWSGMSGCWATPTPQTHTPRDRWAVRPPVRRTAIPLDHWTTGRSTRRTVYLLDFCRLP